MEAIAQTTAILEGSELDSPGRRFDWHDIEPILKWTAVAYALGFLTVMVHTYRLGVPVLQVMDPLNVWIGAPLAVVFYFLDRFAMALKRAVRDMALHVKTTLLEITKIGNPSPDELCNMYGQVVDAVAEAVSVAIVPFLPLRTLQQWLQKTMARVMWWRIRKFDPAMIQAAEQKIPQEQRRDLILYMRRGLVVLRGLAGVYLALNSIFIILLIPVICWTYITAAYPLIPQTLGGGRPTPVALIISEEKIPKTPDFKGWLAGTGESQPSGAPRTIGNPAGGTKVIAVTLYLRTEHEIYVRKESGPLVAFSEHTIDGMVFDTK
jgi:hypothetical protein